MKLPYLWKVDSNGNIIVWKVWTEDNLEIKERFVITAATGISKDIVKTKPQDPIEHSEVNVGKSNYKDACMVANEKAERSWKDMKEKRGYSAILDTKVIRYMALGRYQDIRRLIFDEIGVTSIDDARLISQSFKSPTEYESVDEYLSNPLNCMLSTDINKASLGGEDHSIEYPIIAQTKYDGQRFICTLIGDDLVITTRQKKRKELLPHITEELAVLMEVTIEIRGSVDGYFDCEAIGIDADGGHLSRQQIQSRVSRTINKHKNSDQIYFIVFDYAVPNVQQVDRLKFLTDLFSDRRVAKLDYIKFCNTDVVEDSGELKIFHDSNISDGYEGTILRCCEGLYLPRRCSNSIKLKETYAEEAVIVDADHGNGSAKDCVIWIVRSIETDQEYRAVHQANVSKRRSYYINRDRYIGRVVSVKFYSRNDSGIPSHAIVEGFRDDLE
jgi:hypothetical protein